MKVFGVILFVALTIAVLGSTTLTSPAFAQSALTQARLCLEDMKKFCSDVQRGGGRIAQCLENHEAELSDGCKDFVQTAKSQLKEVRHACESDVQKFCQDAPPGEVGIGRCLKEHEADLSAQCKTAVSQVRSRMKAQTQ